VIGALNYTPDYASFRITLAAESLAKTYWTMASPSRGQSRAKEPIARPRLPATVISCRSTSNTQPYSVILAASRDRSFELHRITVAAENLAR